MSIECPRCSAAASMRARYCPRCGTALSAPLDPADPDGIAGPYIAWQKARRERAVGWLLLVLGLLLIFGALFGFRLGPSRVLMGVIGIAFFVMGRGALDGDNGKGRRTGRRR